MKIDWKAVWAKIVKWFITYGKYVIGVLGVIIIGIITVTTLNKFGSAELFTNIKEWAFLKDHGYKKKGDVIVDKETKTEIPVPPPYKDEKVSGIGHTPETTIGDVIALRPGEVDTHEDAVNEPENEKTSTSTTTSEKVATSEQSSVSTEIKADVVSPEIKHEVIDRKNVEPIVNSAKEVLTQKRK